MATQTVEFIAPTGQTVDAKIFAIGSDTVVQSVTATEQTNRKGVYRVAYTDAPDATYRLIGFVGAVPVASWWVTLTLTTATFQSYEMPYSGAGDASQTTLLQVKAKTDLIAAGTTFTGAPVSTNGIIYKPLFIATDYKAANGAALSWNVDAVPGFVVASSVCYLSFKKETTTLKLTGTVSDLGGGIWKLSFDMLASQTYLLPTGFYQWWVDIAYTGVLINKVYQDKPVEFRIDPNGPLAVP